MAKAAMPTGRSKPSRRPSGPPYWPIRKDGEPFERLPPDGNEFWRALCTWNQEEDREQFRAD